MEAAAHIVDLTAVHTAHVALAAARTAAARTAAEVRTAVVATLEVADKLQFECTNFGIRHPKNFVHWFLIIN